MSSVKSLDQLKQELVPIINRSVIEGNKGDLFLPDITPDQIADFLALFGNQDYEIHHEMDLYFAMRVPGPYNTFPLVKTILQRKPATLETLEEQGMIPLLRSIPLNLFMWILDNALPTTNHVQQRILEKFWRALGTEKYGTAVQAQEKFNYLVFGIIVCRQKTGILFGA
jgi:hypothetical protein